MAAKKHIDSYFDDLDRILSELRSEIRDALPRMAEVLEQARDEGAVVYTMGNGGSGAAASHLANDLNKYTISEDQSRFRCVSLVDNTPVILAWANDQAYDDVFVEQLENHLDPEDVVVGISGSGQSTNCVKAIDYANQVGATTITWTGFGGGKMADLSDIPVVIPSDSMVRCEDAHVIIHHCLVSYLKKRADRSGSGTGVQP